MQRRDRRIELRGERCAPAHRAAPRFPRSAKSAGRPLTAAPERRNACLARSVVQQRADLIHEVVAAGAIHRPIIGQALTGAEDLLDDQPCRTLRRIRRPLRRQRIKSRAQSAAIARRIGQAIDMIDPHTVDQPLAGTAGAASRASPRTPPRPRCAVPTRPLMSKKRRQLIASPALRHQASR